MKFSFNNDTPIYLQLINQLKIEIISGNISLGKKLPSVRDLAIECKVNPNTIQRALSELEEIGIIYTERTNGKFVTEDKKLINKLKKEYAFEESKKYVEVMKNIGFNKDEIIDFIKNLKG